MSDDFPRVLRTHAASMDSEGWYTVANALSRAAVEIEGCRRMTPPMTHSETAREAVADAMRKRRHELINEPLARIWPQLADAALSVSHAAVRKHWRCERWQDGSSPVGKTNILCDDLEVVIAADIPDYAAADIVREHNAAIASPAATSAEGNVPPAAPAVKPVAWLVVSGQGRRSIIDAQKYDAESDDFWISRAAKAAATIIPLYAHPAPAESAQVKVKPLEWQLFDNGDAYAASAITTYFAKKDGTWGVRNGSFNGAGENLDEAKAAAQADYESRIRATLNQEPTDG